MQTLYIDRRDTRLDVDRERILVHSPSLPRPLSIAFTYLSSIVISAKTQLHSHVLLACASRGITALFWIHVLVSLMRNIFRHQVKLFIEKLNNLKC